MNITPAKIKTLPELDNIANELDEELLNRIGSKVVVDYNNDVASRGQWERRYLNSLKLASQAVEVKNTPWENAANIKYPLLTTACLQFHARAYAQLVPPTDIVKGRVIGGQDEQTQNRAIRIGKHMSYQVLEEMEEWEEDMDKLLIIVPITGCEFKKSYYDPDKGRNCSELVLSRDLVVNYWAKSLEAADRKTHVLYFSKNEIEEKIRAGIYLQVDLGAASAADTKLREEMNKVQGRVAVSEDDATPYTILEYHGFWDLDEDGYKEPYIITVDLNSQKVLRMTARFDEESVLYESNNKIAKIEPVEYFTKYDFIPDPNGGFYGIGFGSLLGPINETINTSINQLLDAGTLSIRQGGFLAKGIKMPGGALRFAPGEWKQINVPGLDLKNAIVPLPVKEPSTVLFSLLELMINAGERLSSVTDILTGENPGQNQPLGTTVRVIEEGMKVFTGIYKRIRRALSKEFKKLYRLNKIYLPDTAVLFPTGMEESPTGAVIRSDYEDPSIAIIPSADPTVATQAQKLMKAETLVQLLPMGGFNDYEVKKRLLEALEIPNIEKILIPPEQQKAPVDPKIVTKQMEMQSKAEDRAVNAQLKVMELQLKEKEIVIDAKLEELDAEIKRLKVLTDAATKHAQVELDERRVNEVETKKIENDSKKKTEKSKE